MFIMCYRQYNYYTVMQWYTIPRYDVDIPRYTMLPTIIQHFWGGHIKPVVRVIGVSHAAWK